MVAVNSIIASINAAQGVLVLDGTGFVPTANMPATLSPTGTQTISPGNKIVNIRDVLRLQQRYTVDNALLTSATAGDMIYLVDGDAGNPCLSLYDGTKWRIVRLMTEVGDVGASLSGAFTLACDATVV